MLPESRQKIQSEARNLPSSGCKSMTEGPTIMLEVFITLLYTHTMPINHYCSKPTSLRCHLMAKYCLKVGRKSKSEAWNLPSSGCKSMTEGPTIMLGVFITLLYTYILLINYYSIKPTSLRCHLMAKCYLRVGKKSRSEARNRQHGAVKVWWRDLQSCAGSVHQPVMHIYNAKQALL